MKTTKTIGVGYLKVYSGFALSLTKYHDYLQVIKELTNDQEVIDYFEWKVEELRISEGITPDRYAIDFEPLWGAY